LAQSAITVLVYLVFFFLGALEGNRLRKKDPEVNLDSMLKQAPHLYILVMAALLPILIGLYPSLNIWITWNGPYLLDLYMIQVRFALLASIIGYLSGACLIVAFKTHDKSRNLLATGSAILFFIIISIQWWHTRPVTAGKSYQLRSHQFMVEQTANTDGTRANEMIHRQIILHGAR